MIDDKTSIGYIPSNRLCDMVRDFSSRDDSLVSGFVSEVNEGSNSIKLALGFYKEFKKTLIMNTKLVKTTKKDEYGCSRQENLALISEGDVVTIRYSHDTETYLVVDDFDNELGELSKNNSDKIRVLEDEGNIFYSEVTDIDYIDSGNIVCKVIIYSLEKW